MSRSAILVLLLCCLRLRAQTDHTGLRWALDHEDVVSEGPTLATSSSLSHAERASLIRIAERELTPYRAEFGISSTARLREIAANTGVKCIDLDGDGASEIIVQFNDIQAGCGGTGNCPLLILRKTPHGYRKLLSTRGKDGIGGVEGLSIQAARTKGFSDLVLETHDSAFAKYLESYTFDGHLYRSNKLYFAEIISPTDGHEYNPPRITLCRSWAHCP